MDPKSDIFVESVIKIFSIYQSVMGPYDRLLKTNYEDLIIIIFRRNRVFMELCHDRGSSPSRASFPRSGVFLRAHVRHGGLNG